MKDVTRIKRLLEMKQRAAMLPKSKLAEYEDEYAELLERIEFERKRLEIDEESIRALKDTVEHKYSVGKARERFPKEVLKSIRDEEKAIDKAARVADLEDLEYHKNKLIEIWKAECGQVFSQISMNERGE